MKNHIKRLVSAVTSVLILASATPSLRLQAAEIKSEKDDLPIMTDAYINSNWYWNNIFEEAGNFTLFAFDSIVTNDHLNGNIATKKWYVGNGLPEPHTSMRDSESHSLPSIISEAIITDAYSVDFGDRAISHSDETKMYEWNFGMINGIYLPEDYTIKTIIPAQYDEYGNVTPAHEGNVTNGETWKHGTFYYNSEGKKIDLSTTQLNNPITYGHATSSFLDFNSLKGKYINLSNSFATLDQNVTIDSNGVVTLNSNGTNVLNISAASYYNNPIKVIENINYTEAEGYSGNQSLIVNIDMSNMTYFDGLKEIVYKTLDGTLVDDENMAFKGTNIIYNFYNAPADAEVRTQRTVGHILAPNCVAVPTCGSGTIIANKIFEAWEVHMAYIPKGISIQLPTKDIKIYKNSKANTQLKGAELVLTGKDSKGETVIFTDEQFNGDAAAKLINSGKELRFLSGDDYSVIKMLPAGTYTLTEAKAPDGYLIADPIDFEITKDLKLVINGNEEQDVLMVDEYATDVYISKTDIDGSKELAGAKLKLTGVDALGNAVIFSEDQVKKGKDADIISTGSALEFVSGSEKTLIQDLPNGTYTLEEKIAPKGYALTTEITFTIVDNYVVSSKYVTHSDSDNKAIVTMKDALSTRDVRFSKSSVTGEEVFGATLVLAGKDVNGKLITFNDEQVELGNEAKLNNTGNEVSFISGSESTKIKDLVPGTYTLTETNVPSGYLKAESITFDITLDMELVVDGKKVDKIVMVDEYATDVNISKKDLGNGEELPGAKLILTGTDTHGNAVNFSTDKIVADNKENIKSTGT
ncbi:MAG: hypothetical protein J6U54_18280 [Clostridiales bacterium]|nr:hypothetical protein [Clostridiales bacterium]